MVLVCGCVVLEGINYILLIAASSTFSAVYRAWIALYIKCRVRFGQVNMVGSVG